MHRSIAFVMAIACASCGGGEKPGAEPAPATTAGEEAAPQAESAIRVSAPAADAVVNSPLVVTGEARGMWYFEATFPVTLLDADGRPVLSSYAQAEGEWMTEQFVPFRTELTFTAPASATGTLVLERANPSGLPEHAAEIRIPVRFR